MFSKFQKVNAAVTLSGLTLGAIAQACQGGGDMKMAVLAGVISYFAGIAGNQSHSWASPLIGDEPTSAKEIFQNHHLQGLLSGAVTSTMLLAVENMHDAQSSEEFQNALATFPKFVVNSTELPHHKLTQLGSFDLPDFLTHFAAQEGNVEFLSVKEWDAMLAEQTLLAPPLRQHIAETLHQKLASGLWNHVKDANEKAPQAFAAVELLYLSRILSAVEGQTGAPDLSELIEREESLIEKLDAAQAEWFERLWQQNQRFHVENMDAHRRTERLLRLVLRKLHRLEQKTEAPAMIHQIPAPPRDFVGRGEELDALRAAMEGKGVAISGLAGMGGVGKTALALKLAQELATAYPDGGLYLDLKGVETVPVSVKEALQFFIRAFRPMEQLPDDEAQLGGIYQSSLHDKRLVVLLDNAKDAAQVEPLLPPDSCAVVVTARHYFTVPGLVPRRLDTLPPHDAQTLLLGIAPRIGECAAEMARVLGYLPQALRLAASALAQKANLWPQDYLKRLEKARTRLDFVQASLQLSYDLLSADLQTLWRTLSVFPATFDDAAAAAVWELELDDAQDNLGDLLAFSMVQWDETTRRYRLHDLARDFADAQLDETAKYAAQKRHATHYLIVLSHADDLYEEGHEAILRGLQLFDAERANIEAGQTWAATHAANDENAARLAMYYPNAVYILNLRLSTREWIVWLESQRAAAQQLKERGMEGNASGNLGLAYARLGEMRRAIEYHEQALEVSRKIDDQYGEGNTLGNLGIAYRHLGETQRAIEVYEQALAIDREIGDRRGEGLVLCSLGVAYFELGDLQRAIELFEKQLEVVREIGDVRGEGNALGNLGCAYFTLGNASRAITFHDLALHIFREIDDRRGESEALWNYGEALNKLGMRAQAMNSAISALNIFEQLEHPYAIEARRQLEEWGSEVKN